LPELLDGAALVFAADASLNQFVTDAAKARGIPVNAVDAAEISTFITPSIVDRDPVVVAIGTEGAAPVLGQGIRARIDAMLPARLGALAAAARDLRDRVAETVPAGNRRRSFWQKFFFGAIRDAFLDQNVSRYAHEVETALQGESAPARGRISLVGASEPDPELLTLKAQRRLHEADIILHDHDVPQAILELARRDAVRLAVTPATAAKLALSEVAAGRYVVRLTTDRIAEFLSDEEAMSYAAAGVPLDIVAEAHLPDHLLPGAQIVPFPDRDDTRNALLRAAS
jgi:uroporphyrin-III C-methyltransferase/precorrin-2 dehydrogenase/sirohydrochlorin ferrochelatase